MQFQAPIGAAPKTSQRWQPQRAPIAPATKSFTEADQAPPQDSPWHATKPMKQCRKDDGDASTVAPSSSRHDTMTDVSTMSGSRGAMPQENLFRMMAGRGAAPLKDQVASMEQAIADLQAKLSEVEGRASESDVSEMKQSIQQLSNQWGIVEAHTNMNTATDPETPLRVITPTLEQSSGTWPQQGATDTQAALNKGALEFKPIRAPPGLDLTAPKKPAAPKKKTPVKLSLVALCGATDEMPAYLSPPGLEKSEVSLEDFLEAPPGLSMADCLDAPICFSKGGDSDGSQSTAAAGGLWLSDVESSGESDGEPVKVKAVPLKMSLCDMVLADVSQLKANAPMFTPLLPPTAAAMLLGETQRTSLRTKLCTTASSYVPSEAAPVDAVTETWQKWHMRNALYGGQPGAAPEEWQDGVSSYDTSLGYDGTYEWEKTEYEEYDGTSTWENTEDWYSEYEQPYAA